LLGFFASTCASRDPHCAFLSSSWASVTGESAFCGPNFCYAALPLDLVVDPFHEDLPCESWDTEAGSTQAQWQQDWFIYRNLLPEVVEDGFYVDIGAFHPFKLSNTVFFDQCLGWDGICVEPNPSMEPYFRAYRSCRHMRNCVWSSRRSARLDCSTDAIECTVTDEHVQKGFAATCLPLEEVIPKDRTVHVLSVDAEGAEVEIFRDFNFSAYDIRVVVVEVGSPTRYMQMDAIFLPQGYVKVGVMGGDWVYARWPWTKPLALPGNFRSYTEGILQDYFAYMDPDTHELIGVVNYSRS